MKTERFWLVYCYSQRQVFTTLSEAKQFVVKHAYHSGNAIYHMVCGGENDSYWEKPLSYCNIWFEVNGARFSRLHKW